MGDGQVWVYNPDRYQRSTALVLGTRDVQVVERFPKWPEEAPRGVRGQCWRFTDSSRKRLLWSVRNEPAGLPVLGCLTYPAEFPTDGRIVKRDLSAFRKRARRAYPSLVTYWALEFQTRGAPHVHTLWSQPLPLDWLGETWYDVVGSNDPKHRRAGTQIDWVREPDGAARYMAKYTAKRDQKTVPPDYRAVGRFWGRWGPRASKVEVEGALAEKAAAYLRAEAARRVAAGGYGPSTEYSFYLQDSAATVRALLGAKLRPSGGVGGRDLDNVVSPTEGAQCGPGEQPSDAGGEGRAPAVPPPLGSQGGMSDADRRQLDGE